MEPGLTDGQSDVEEQWGWPAPKVPSEALKWRREARKRGRRRSRSRSAAAADCDTEQRLVSLHDRPTAVQEELTDADSAGDQQRHVEVDERGGPVDSGDRAQARSRPSLCERFEVLLDDVQRDLDGRQRQPDGDQSGHLRPTRYWLDREFRVVPAPDPPEPGDRAIETLIQRLPRSPDTDREYGAQHSEHARDREHVSVKRARQPLGAPDPEVFEGVACPEADEGKKHGGRPKRLAPPIRDHGASI